MAVDSNLANSEFSKTGEDTAKRRFAGSVLPYQCNTLAGFYGEIETVKNIIFGAAIAELEATNLNHG